MPEAETTAWVAAVVGDGGTVSVARQALVDNLIAGLKADAVFAKLDRLWLFRAENTQSALRDLVAASAATAINSPAFAANAGYTGASTKYIDSNFNPSTAPSPKFVQDSASLFAWSNSTGVNEQMMGQFNLQTFIYPHHAGTAYAAINEGFTVNFFAGVADGFGLYHANRNGAATEQFYKNGSQIQSQTNASIAVENTNFRFLMAQVEWLGECGAGGFGQSLDATQATALYQRLATYKAATSDGRGTFAAFSTPQHDGLTVTRMIGY